MSRTLSRDTRHISLARALHARLYVNCEGRIFAVGGKVAHAKLAEVLARQDRCPTAAEAPTPADLGVSCDGELSPELLHSVSRALNRWQKELAAEMQRRPAQRRRTAQLVQEQQEIERLSARLSLVRRWQEELAGGGEPAGALFFLDSHAEGGLQTALEQARRAHPLSPLIAWQARVVYWLSGECATRRFLSATTNLLNALPEVSCWEQVRSFQQAVMVWKQRSKRERLRHLLVEMNLHIQRLPPVVARAGMFSTRLRLRTFDQHCDLLIDRCSQVLMKAQHYREHILPAALAALAATDGSAVSLSVRGIRKGAKEEDFALLVRTIRDLAEQIGQPGYDALLVAIDQLADSSNEFNYGRLCQLLGQGNSLADVVWAQEQELLGSLKASNLKIAAVRRLSEVFAKRGCPLSTDGLCKLVSDIRQQEDLAPIHAWLTWLGCVHPRAFTPRIRKAVQTAFWRLYLPSVQRHDWFAQLSPILVDPSCDKTAQSATPLLERIAAYQQLAGKKGALPKSLRKLLESHESRQREHLRARLAIGVLDAAAQARLRYLENAAVARPDVAKICRTADEAFLLLGIEAMSVVTRRLAEAKCREHLGGLVTLLELHQLWDFALWIDKMTEQERSRLRAVIAVRTRQGREYKRHLAENHAWISKMLARGFDLDPWFDAKPQVEIIRGRKMEIGLASDLHRIFLMGAYFNTCLSLGDINEMSVLTNAYDANKQVVFMFAENDAGRRYAVARQLIAVSSECKLLGYRCYINLHRADEQKYQEVQSAMASYCGRLAADCGLELADQGSPEEIGDHFWYDDGECAWPAAARTAWAETCRAKEEFACSIC